MSKLRSLAGDTLVYGLSSSVTRFLSFFLTPLYTNYLSKSENGDVAFVYSLLAFTNIILTLGFEPSVLRFFSKSDAEHNRDVFSTAMIFVGSFSLVVVCVVWLFAKPLSALFGFHDSGSAIVQSAILISAFDAITFVAFALLRMQRKSKRYATLRILAVAVNVACNLLFVVMNHWHVSGVLLAGVVSSGVTVLLFYPEFKEFFRLQINKTLLREMLSFGLPTVPSSFAFIMLQLADRPILTALTTRDAVGIYQVNYRLAIPMMMIASVFESAFKPFYLSHADDPDIKKMLSRALQYFAILCGGVFLLTSFFMEFVVRLPFIGGRFINPLFWEGLGIIPIVLAGYFFTGLMSNFSAGIHITKTTRRLPGITATAAIANVGLNFLLIPYIGYWGAAWATLGAYFIGALAMYRSSQAVFSVEYPWRDIFSVVALTLLIFLAGQYLIFDSLWQNALFRVFLVVIYVAMIFQLHLISPSQVLGLIRREKESKPS